MGDAKWTDASSYSRDDKERTPTAWHLDVFPLTVSVHRHTYYEPTVWLLTAEPFAFRRVLESTDADAAKAEALAIVSKGVAILSSALARARGTEAP
jgi:hypothetical protein